MGRLYITELPRRTGKYLCIEKGNVMYTIARFHSEEGLQRFLDLVKKSPTLKWVEADDEEEVQEVG